MGVVLLVRHGQASAGGPDYDVLSDLGRQQSELIGAELRRRAPRDPLVVTGSLSRQRDTATVAWPGGAAQVDPRWDEYDHLQLLREHGAPVDAASNKTFQAALDTSLLTWLETDGWLGFHERVTAALRDLVAGLPTGRDAIVFTSGGVIAALVSELLGAGSSAFVSLNRVVVNGGITKLITGSTGTSVSTFNEHPHLDGEQRTLLTYR